MNGIFYQAPIWIIQSEIGRNITKAFIYLNKNRILEPKVLVLLTNFGCPRKAANRNRSKLCESVVGVNQSCVATQQQHCRPSRLVGYKYEILILSIFCVSCSSAFALRLPLELNNRTEHMFRTKADSPARSFIYAQ